MNTTRRTAKTPAAAWIVGGALLLALAGCAKSQVDTTGGPPLPTEEPATPAPATAAPSSSAADSPAPADGGASPTPSVSPSYVPASHEPILAAYRRFFEVVGGEAWKIQDDQARYQLLSTVSTELSLNKTSGGIAASVRDGETTYGDVELHPQVVLIQGDLATVEDCQDTSQAGTMRISDGEKISVGVKNTLVKTQLRLGQDGVWRVAAVVFGPDGSCSTHV